MTIARLPKMNALFLVCASLLQIIFGAKGKVEVEPEQITLLEGQNLTALCSSGEPIFECLWKGDKDDDFFAVNPEGNLPEGIEYFGQGFEHGDCGIKILNVTKKYNGLLQCKITYNLRMEDYHPAVYGNMTVVVAKAPNPPQITVKRLDPIGHKHFEENKRIQAECRIERGRPAANILWFIGNESIHDDSFNSLSDIVTEDLEPPYDGEKSVRQSLTRLLRYSDNGKDLRCVADHITSEPNTSNQAIYKLDVYFSPKPKQCAFDNVNETLIVMMYANPKPNHVTWQLNEHEILEGDTDTTKFVLRSEFPSVNLTNAGQDKWQGVLKITKVNDTDFDRIYTLRARNIIGQTECRVFSSECYYGSYLRCTEDTASYATFPAPSLEIIATPANYTVIIEQRYTSSVAATRNLAHVKVFWTVISIILSILALSALT